MKKNTFSFQFCLRKKNLLDSLRYQKTYHQIVSWEFFEGRLFDCLFLNERMELPKVSKEKKYIEGLKCNMKKEIVFIKKCQLFLRQVSNFMKNFFFPYIAHKTSFSSHFCKYKDLD